MICVSAVYPNHAGSRFDADYYRTAHGPMAARLLALHGLTHIRTTAGLAALDDAPPAFWMISEMRFRTREAFDQAMAACGADLFADLPNFTDVEPVLQLSAEPDELIFHANLESASHAQFGP